MTDAEKARLVATPVTLNGYPAAITGRGMPWARITTLASAGKHHIGADWSWPAVARIVADGGAFKC
jgi:hypothetical protein